MAVDIDDVVRQIIALPQDWHRAGTLSANAVRAMVRHIGSAGPIAHTAETGSGRSTLLFSHLSPDHRVFALDCDTNSVEGVRESQIARPESITFVEGPTQITMPNYAYPESLQAALIDGPHGYPFPDLEYFHFYPRISQGGILMVDDIQIPTIGRMFEIIKAEEMFELIEVVDSNLAFFRRTSAPLIDPHSDSWWLQPYNRAYYDRLQNPSWNKRWIDAVTARLPVGVKDAMPAAVKQWAWKRRSS